MTPHNRLNHSTLKSLLNSSRITPLSYFFALFILDHENNSDGKDSDNKNREILGLTAALVSEKNINGNVCIDLSDLARKQLFEESSESSQIEHNYEAVVAPELDVWLSTLHSSRTTGTPENNRQPLILDGERLYLGKYFQAEQVIAHAIQSRLNNAPELDKKTLQSGLTTLFNSDDSLGKEPDWQKLACATAVSQRFAVISGGPGTGKTTTVVKVLALLLEQDPDMIIRLAAPTGKAAARMSESITARINASTNIQELDCSLLKRIPDNAETLHRLLGSTGHSFRYNKDNPLVLDCLVIDEASMIDQSMMTRIFSAIPDDTRLILLGDRDQLASVEAGNVLGDITGHGHELSISQSQAQQLADLTGISAEVLLSNNSVSPSNIPPISNSIALLRRSYRFSANSGIGGLAKLINTGEAEESLKFIENEPADIIWYESNERSVNPDAISYAINSYLNFLEAENVSDAIKHFESFRVLCAHKKGAFGVNEINERIKNTLVGMEKVSGGEAFHKMPIMVTANDYENNLFNGDIGIIWKDATGKLRVFFKFSEEEPRSVPLSILSEYVPAWAMTVHKSQGSEFDEVLLVLPHEANSPILSKELIYTGVTRAKNRVLIQSSREAFIEGCQSKVKRTSGLAKKLGWQ